MTVGIFGLTFLLLLTLKLLGLVTISWLWVFAPLAAPVIIVVTALLVLGVLIGIAAVIKV